MTQIDHSPTPTGTPEDETREILDRIHSITGGDAAEVLRYRAIRDDDKWRRAYAEAIRYLTDRELLDILDRVQPRRTTMLNLLSDTDWSLVETTSLEAIVAVNARSEMETSDYETLREGWDVAIAKTRSRQ